MAFEKDREQMEDSHKAQIFDNQQQQQHNHHHPHPQHQHQQQSNSASTQPNCPGAATMSTKSSVNLSPPGYLMSGTGLTSNSSPQMLASWAPTKGKLILPSALWALLIMAGVCFLFLLVSLNKSMRTLDTLVEIELERSHKAHHKQNSLQKHEQAFADKLVDPLKDKLMFKTSSDLDQDSQHWSKEKEKEREKEKENENERVDPILESIVNQFINSAPSSLELGSPIIQLLNSNQGSNLMLPDQNLGQLIISSEILGPEALNPIQGHLNGLWQQPMPNQYEPVIPTSNNENSGTQITANIDRIDVNIQPLASKQDDSKQDNQQAFLDQLVTSILTPKLIDDQVATKAKKDDEPDLLSLLLSNAFSENKDKDDNYKHISEVTSSPNLFKIIPSKSIFVQDLPQSDFNNPTTSERPKVPQSPYEFGSTNSGPFMSKMDNDLNSLTKDFIDSLERIKTLRMDPFSPSKAKTTTSHPVKPIYGSDNSADTVVFFGNADPELANQPKQSLASEEVVPISAINKLPENNQISQLFQLFFGTPPESQLFSSPSQMNRQVPFKKHHSLVEDLDKAFEQQKTTEAPNLTTTSTTIQPSSTMKSSAMYAADSSNDQFETSAQSSGKSEDKKAPESFTCQCEKGKAPASSDSKSSGGSSSGSSGSGSNSKSSGTGGSSGSSGSGSSSSSGGSSGSGSSGSSGSSGGSSGSSGSGGSGGSGSSGASKSSSGSGGSGGSGSSGSSGGSRSMSSVVYAAPNGHSGSGESHNGGHKRVVHDDNGNLFANIKLERGYQSSGSGNGTKVASGKTATNSTSKPSSASGPVKPIGFVMVSVSGASANATKPSSNKTESSKPESSKPPASASRAKNLLPDD